jgi:cytochrome P450 family 103
MEAVMSSATLDSLPTTPKELPPGVDKYAMYRELRAQSPLAMGPGHMVLALRHEHFDLITSPKTRQLETEFLAARGITTGPIHDAFKNGVLQSNGEAHTRRRAPLAKTFAFKLMDGIRARAGELVGEVVTENLGRGPVDFLNLIAAQLPARIIADVLGVPREDLPTFLAFIPQASEMFGLLPHDRIGAIEANLEAFNAYIDSLTEARRTTPRRDFISDLITETDAAGWTEAELRAQILLLILAGSDTTRGTLCMTLSTLLQHQEQWRQFCADPDGLKKNVVQEGLRFEPVVEGIGRVVEEDVEIDGIVVPRGRMLYFTLISSLRDPAVYRDPETFDIHRTDHPRWHPIFGAGPHRCLGEALARAELEEAMAAIARLAPNTRLVGDPPCLKGTGLRQVDQMQVAFA